LLWPKNRLKILPTFCFPSDIKRFIWEIIQKLKIGEIDILVGVNLLREGIDLPEVGFIGILDADKEWFLRSTTALIQNIWRAARNPVSEVALYADSFTPSIVKALRETYRRRHHQEKHNIAHGITPEQAISNIKSLDTVRSDQNLVQDFNLTTRGKNKRLTRMTKKEKALVATDLKKQLDEAIAQWKFEDAAVLRDQLKDLVGE
jgi:excinuclease ABC subunit B